VKMGSGWGHIGVEGVGSVEGARGQVVKEV